MCIIEWYCYCYCSFAECRFSISVRVTLSADIMSISNRYRLMLAHGLASKLQATAMLTGATRKKAIHENAPTTKLVNQNQCARRFFIVAHICVCRVFFLSHSANILNSCNLRYLACLEFSSLPKHSVVTRYLSVYTFFFCLALSCFCSYRFGFLSIQSKFIAIQWMCQYINCFAAVFSRVHIFR